MALQAAYSKFLAAPTADALHKDATLHYITTTTTYAGATAIVKHLSSQKNQVKIKKQDFLGVVEGHNAIAVEVDTVLEFVTSGGAYLPGMDDNFLADHTVSQAVMHIVTFDADAKILQVRQSWDQGSLLKQLDIIGKSGRNWPIRDSKEQLKMITSCLKSTDEAVPLQATETPLSRSRAVSNNILRDPHATLSLFAPRDEVEQDPAAFVSPKAGNRPRQRSFTEILGDEPAGGPASPSAGRERSGSPIKPTAPKAGAAKHFTPNRLFQADDESEAPDLPEKPSQASHYRVHPNKYNHFDFADGSEPQDAPQRAAPAPAKSKHSSQWSFDDFVTPAKVAPTKTLQKNHQGLRHWGAEDDVVEETPARKPVQGKLRRDAESHFELQDDGTPRDTRASRPRGTAHNNGLGLYRNNVYNEEDEDPANGSSDGQALGNITNLKNRGKALGSQFAMTDDSPGQDAQQMPSMGEDRKKAVKMMDANWSSYDTSPVQKENQPTKPTKASGGGIHLGGDGMGGSKGSNRDWLFGATMDDDAQPANVPGRKQGAQQAGGFSWDF